MPRITADEINMQKHVRFFLQPGGSEPGNALLYSGVDGQYMNVESTTNPQRGGISPKNVHDPRVVGRYRRVGRQIDPPDFPSSTIQFLQKKDALPRHLYNLGDCVATLYQVVGDCKDLSDFVNGWSSYVKISSNGEETEQTEAGGSFDGDEALQDDLDFTWANVYNVGKLGFGEKASVEVYSEVIDVVYGSRVQCGNCGPSDDGTKLVFAVTNNTVASPGQAPSIIYSLDSGTTITEQAITGAASTDVPRAIDVVGNYLVVLFDDGATGGYFYTELNNITGAPGSTWTKVTTGFVTGFAPTDMYVLSAREVWISAENGYIYKVTNITSGATVSDAAAATTNTLNRIKAYTETIVAVGESGTVVYSTNRGRTFTTVTTAPSGNGLDALEIITDYLWWVGDDAGDVYYTDNQGTTAWTQETGVPGASTAIRDIAFATDEVGYILYDSAGPTAGIITTFNAGVDWTNTAPRLLNIPTADQFNRLAYPDVPNLNVAANNILVGGLAGNGSDGILLLATVAVV